jgi:hypothetical protein
VTRLVVLPSPLLGAVPYAPLAQALHARGYDAEVAAVDVRADEPVDEFLDALAAAAAHADVLVPHSNAGRFAAEVARRVGAAVVYVDSQLPDVGDQAPFADFVQGLVDEDGLLPVWTDWWSPDELADVVPPAWVETLRRSQPRLRPEFLLAAVPAPTGWRQQRAAYLAFGDAYAVESAAAAAAGWPVRVVSGTHLLLLTEPARVAAEIDGLVSGLAPGAP